MTSPNPLSAKPLDSVAEAAETDVTPVAMAATVPVAPAPATPPAPASRLDTVRRIATIAVQVCVLIAIWLIADALVRHLHLPVPAGVLGLLALLAVLMSGRVPPRWVKLGADWMLSEMLLFFVPSAVAIIQYGHLIESTGIRLILVLLPGTLLVMAATALAVEFGVKLERGIALRRIRRARATRVPRQLVARAAHTGSTA